MSRCSRIWRNEGRFLGLLFLEGTGLGETEILGTTGEELERPFPESTLENRILERALRPKSPVHRLYCPLAQVLQ